MFVHPPNSSEEESAKGKVNTLKALRIIKLIRMFLQINLGQCPQSFPKITSTKQPITLKLNILIKNQKSCSELFVKKFPSLDIAGKRKHMKHFQVKIKRNERAKIFHLATNSTIDDVLEVAIDEWILRRLFYIELADYSKMGIEPNFKLITRQEGHLLGLFTMDFFRSDEVDEFRIEIHQLSELYPQEISS